MRSPRATRATFREQRPKTRFPASTGRRCACRCVGLSVHGRDDDLPPHQRIATTRSSVTIPPSSIYGQRAAGGSADQHGTTRTRTTLFSPVMLLARRSRRAADYKAAHEGHRNCHQGCQHSNTDQGKDVGGNCREVALVPRNKGCEQRFHGHRILLDIT